ncbi:MAG TPA: UPF0182 family protein [Acidimicrobiia bacterium]|nr:UPF0182 family protein [Acidimicrobiia bacterium]
MRMPTIERRRRPSNRRILLIVLAAVLAVLLVSLRGIAGFYTDYLWFKELGYTDVWRGLLVAKALPTVVFTVVFFLLILGNLIIADRLQPRFRPAGPEEELVERYRQFIGPYAGRVRLAVAAFLAVVAASGLTSQWNAWILFRHRVPFGGKGDAQFGADIGFYVFTLPFLRFIFEWTFAALVIVLLVTAVAHYLNGGIRVQGPLQRVTPQVKAHLSVILGAMALLKAFGYWLQRFELNFSSRGVVQGASYTDVKAELPALNMLIVISVAAALLFFVNRWLKGWVLPIIAVGLWSFVSVVIGGIYPTVIQKASVEPNELQKESRYIQRNINATRAAFGLDRVTEKDFSYQENLTGATINANQGTIGDARLWDPDVLRQTYRELQQIRPQYTFGDVDIDRYNIEGHERQVVLSARELDLNNLPSQTWQNRHLVYTHGYGLVASPSNGVTKDGAPEFLVKDIPPTNVDQAKDLQVTQPAIYYGEKLPGYAFVDTTQKEFDYPREPNDAATTYAGKGGVKVDNIIRRAALFLRFGDIKVLISSQITSKSKALYLRDVRDRVKKAAPFLKFDADPYPVLLNGRILWVIDGYTVTDRYPYSQAYTPDPNRLTTASGLSTRLNYVRNSIKATVDAYDGTVKFYVFDDPAHPDPIIKAYRKAFPKLFTDRSQMPAGLVDHLRYPEDLFRVQTDRFADYHVTDPATFYQNRRQWAVAQDPGSGVLQLSTQTTAPPPPTPGRPAVTGPSKRARMDPYYLLMKLPGQTKEDFLILQPFVPVGAGGSELANLSGFMVAKSDPGDYGKLESYAMPVGQVVRGPDQINAIINTTPDISSRLTLLNQQGSEIIQGSMLLIPVEQSLLYIRPLYIQGSGATKLPEFKFVVAVYAGKAVMGESLPDALSQLFPDLGQPPPPGGGQANPPPGNGGPTQPSADVAGLLAQADQAYNDAQTALKSGNLSEYQKQVDRMADLIRQSRAAAAPTTTTTAPAGGGGSAAATTTTSRK